MTNFYILIIHTIGDFRDPVNESLVMNSKAKLR